VSVKKVNILSVELDEPLDETGFRHVATSVGLRLGAQRIGASVYQAEAGVPIWPYHYHHGIEEWLYVIGGAPVLRDPAGERILTTGDLVCFPSGHVGAHTVKGPGRFVIFATGYQLQPYMSVYPDSDKVSGPEGILLRSSAVGYWHGEGTAGPSESVEIVREPKGSPPQPTVNALALRQEAADRHAPTGFRYRAAKLGPLLGADRLDGTLVDVDPGEGAEPYHYVHGREEWLLVLAGTPTVRHPHGEDRADCAGDAPLAAVGTSTTRSKPSSRSASTEHDSTICSWNQAISATSFARFSACSRTASSGSTKRIAVAGRPAARPKISGSRLVS
jgi:uncharacterized cupin superfamily protein